MKTLGTHHLAIVHRTFAPEILAGRKTVECRLSRRRFAPFDLIDRGHVLWFKTPSQAIFAKAVVRRVAFFDDLTPAKLIDLGRRYQDSVLATDPRFWQRTDVRYASLIQFGAVRASNPKIPLKKDRRAWVILDEPPYAEHAAFEH